MQLDWNDSAKAQKWSPNATTRQGFKSQTHFLGLFLFIKSFPTLGNHDYENSKKKKYTTAEITAQPHHNGKISTEKHRQVTYLWWKDVTLPFKPEPSKKCVKRSFSEFSQKNRTEKPRRNVWRWKMTRNFTITKTYNERKSQRKWVERVLRYMLIMLTT